MGTLERRKKIMNILFSRRHEIVSNLAFELGVSERTIRRDIEALSIDEPIYTQAGRYGGGVYVIEGYNPQKPYFSDDELKLMINVYDCLTGNRKDADKYVINFEKIIKKYTSPKRR